MGLLNNFPLVCSMADLSAQISSLDCICDLQIEKERPIVVLTPRYGLNGTLVVRSFVR